MCPPRYRSTLDKCNDDRPSLQEFLYAHIHRFIWSCQIPFICTPLYVYTLRSVSELYYPTYKAGFTVTFHFWSENVYLLKHTEKLKKVAWWISNNGNLVHCVKVENCVKGSFISHYIVVMISSVVDVLLIKSAILCA